MVQKFKINKVTSIDIALLAYFENRMHRLFTVTNFLAKRRNGALKQVPGFAKKLHLTSKKALKRAVFEIF